MKKFIKGMLQFLSIIACTFVILLATSSDFEGKINEFTYGVRDNVQGEAVDFSEVYRVPEGQEKIYDAQIIEVEKPEKGEIIKADSKIGRIITAENKNKKNGDITFTFSGDSTLGALNNTPVTKGFHGYVSASGSATYPFDNVKKLFEKDDLTYINFEGTLTNKRVNTQKEFRFAGEPEWARSMVAASSVEVCNLANNHSYDYLRGGYEDTVKVIEEAGMHALDETKPYIGTINGIQTVIISGNYIHDAAKPQRAGQELTNFLVSEIKKYKRDNNIVILSVHWGVELRQQPIPEQKTRAYAYADAGADIIIGHHPHVLQGIEKYKGKYIFYSLGNFAFGGNPSVNDKSRLTMLLRTHIALREGKTEVTGITILPCKITSHKTPAVNNYQPEILYGQEAEKAKNTIIDLSKGMKYGLTDFDCPTTEID